MALPTPLRAPLLRSPLGHTAGLLAATANTSSAGGGTEVTPRPQGTGDHADARTSQCPHGTGLPHAAVKPCW